MRLDKFLAEASIGTRKEVRQIVKSSKVTVNNQTILDPALEINENTDQIKVLGKEVLHTGKVYYMFNKPMGCITARKDDHCKTVLDYFNVEQVNGLFPVGRLDKDTEGLLLLTNDGEFNHNLMYPDKHVDKTYFFWAFGSLNSIDKERLETGVIIGKEEAVTKAAKIQVVTEGIYLELKEKMNIGQIKKMNKLPEHQLVVSGYLTISEGRKHQVKRMLKAVGCKVVYLKRISIGGLMLDENLMQGEYRELTENEKLSILK